MSDLISKQEAIDRLSEVLSSKGEFEKAKQVIIEAPTVDEKEIIRKPFERVVERLEIMADEANDSISTELNHPQYYDGKEDAFCEAIDVIKEEGGIE